MTKPQIFIIYSPGLYGSFVSWWLRYANQDIGTTTPFDPIHANSHITMVDTSIVHLANIDHLKTLLAEDSTKQIYLLHPPKEYNNNERADLNYLIKYVFQKSDSKIIFMTARTSSAGWIHANLCTKISNTWIENEINTNMDIRPWGVSFYAEATTWQKREIISYYLEKDIKNRFPDQNISAWVPSTFVEQFPNKCLTVNIEDLRDSIESTLEKIAEFCQIIPNKENIQKVKQSWLDTQKYTESDLLIKTIIEKTLQDEEYSWRPLLLVEEAFIQFRLRQQGKKLKCCNLDQLPTTSKELRKLIYTIELPNRIWFTGVPGSRWSGIAQTLEQIPGMNTSDRTADRKYTHHEYSGHKGAYFGHGMEFPADPACVDQAWETQNGCCIVKSHEWIDHMNQIRSLYPNDWIMLVYRPDQTSFAWWHEAGGFQIKYPNYSAYGNSANMLSEIIRTNQLILEYAKMNNCKWEYFTSNWVTENFGYNIDVNHVWPDILVTLIKNE